MYAKRVAFPPKLLVKPTVILHSACPISLPQRNVRAPRCRCCHCELLPSSIASCLVTVPLTTTTSNNNNNTNTSTKGNTNTNTKHEHPHPHQYQHHQHTDTTNTTNTTTATTPATTNPAVSVQSFPLSLLAKDEAAARKGLAACAALMSDYDQCMAKVPARRLIRVRAILAVITAWPSFDEMVDTW